MLYNVKAVQQALLDIYAELEKIFRRHNIRYFASGGTCLGAIRHGGFIPWDDDIDLEFPREDYKKLFEVLPQELPDWLELIDYHNIDDFRVIFSKVIITDEVRLEKIQQDAGLQLGEGVFIDLFPLDYIPKSKSRQLVRIIKRFAIKALRYHYNGLRETVLKDILLQMIGTVLNIFYGHVSSLSDCLRAEDELVASYTGKENDFMFLSAWSKYDIQYFFGVKNLRTCDFGVPCWVHFENTSIPVQQNYDKYLTQIYGAWYKLPPVEKRIPTHGRICTWAWRLGSHKVGGGTT